MLLFSRQQFMLVWFWSSKMFWETHAQRQGEGDRELPESTGTIRSNYLHSHNGVLRWIYEFRFVNVGKNLQKSEIHTSVCGKIHTCNEHNLRLLSIDCFGRYTDHVCAIQLVLNLTLIDSFRRWWKISVSTILSCWPSFSALFSIMQMCDGEEMERKMYVFHTVLSQKLLGLFSFCPSNRRRNRMQTKNKICPQNEFVNN